MTIAQFLKTDEARRAIYRTDFSTCKVDDQVHHCLRLMKEGGREWMGLMDDTYLTGAARRQDLVEAIERRKPEDRWEVEQSAVGPFGYPLAVVAREADDAAEIGRRLAASQQPDLVAVDEDGKPIAALPASALTQYPPLVETIQKPLRG